MGSVADSEREQAAGGRPGPARCSTGQPNAFGFNSYTANFAEVKAALPDAEVIGVSVNQGSGSTGLVAGVDRFTVNDTVYEFENPVVPTALTIKDGTGQTAAPTKPFAKPLSTTLVGAGNTPAPGATVTYEVTSGSARFPGGATATATTDANGVAVSPTLTAGLVPGPVTVIARSGTLERDVQPHRVRSDGASGSRSRVDRRGTVHRGAGFVHHRDVHRAQPQLLPGHEGPDGPDRARRAEHLTAAPGGLVAGAVVVYTEPTLGPDASKTYAWSPWPSTRGPTAPRRSTH